MSQHIKSRTVVLAAVVLFAWLTATGETVWAQAQGKKPNIVFIMGDDVGWFNIGAYHQGIMSGKTPYFSAAKAAPVPFA